MKTRNRSLPSGWYPETAGEVEELFRTWARGDPSPRRTAAGGIVPHAGWYYSGRLAWRVFSRIDPAVETVVVCGGHLASDHPVLCAGEAGFSTPLGTIAADTAFVERLAETIDLTDDRWADNSVEVQLPFVKHFFPEARLVWLRVPPDPVRAPRLGKLLDKVAAGLSRRIAVLGATDLTHYGENYGFSPAGTGRAAVEWVRNVNDAAVIGAFLKPDAADAVKIGDGKSAACSSGAAACAIAYCAERARATGMQLRPELVEYATSLDVGGPSDSFVGYAAVTYTVG